MIRRENPNFVASIYAPNPKEVTYWIDLTEGPDGLIIKSFVNNKWVKVNEDENTEQSAEIQSLKNRCTNLENNKLDKSTYNEFVQEVNLVHTELDNSKADKATTLAGYGITDAYTKAETNQQISTATAALVDQAPETMDTLNELAAALGDDPNFATTVSNLIGTKLNTSTYTADKATFATKTELSSKVNGTGITGIEVVTELPDTQNENILYIVKAA